MLVFKKGTVKNRITSGSTQQHFNNAKTKAKLSIKRIEMICIGIFLIITFQYHFLLHRYWNPNTNLDGSKKGYSRPIDINNYNIPSSKEIEQLYGDKIVIHGLDDDVNGMNQCVRYKNNVPGTLRYIAPTGLHNTGTNVLYRLLQRNCYIPERWESKKENKGINPFLNKEEIFDCQSKSRRNTSKPGYDPCVEELKNHDKLTGMRNQVPWWKHGFASWRDNAPYLLTYIENQGPGEIYDRKNVLPIVMVKDPVYWISSMCRNRYEVKFMPKFREKCPKFVPEKIRSKFTPKTTILPPLSKKYDFKLEYTSLIDLWNQYYNEWLTNTSYPNLIVRYEDLLFHPKEVITKVCKCGGGKIRDDFQLVEKSAKNTGKGITKSSRNGLDDAMIMYGTKDIRDSVLTRADKKYVNTHLSQDVIHAFGYSPA